MTAGIIGRLMRTGLRRGMVGGSRPWLWVGLAAGFVQVARRLWAREPITESVRLKPGESLEIRHLRSG